jgi:acyl carrier protein
VLDPAAFLRTAIAKQLALPLDTVQPERHLFDDLGLDSLDVIELVMAVEEYYSIEIDELSLNLGTVAEAESALKDLITSAVKKL